MVSLRFAAWVSTVVLATAGSAAAAQEAGPTDPELLLSRLQAALGGREALEALGDVELEGELDLPGRGHRWRAFVRGRPFAVREELSTLHSDPRYDALYGGFSPAPGEPPNVFVSDGRAVWWLDPDGSSGLLHGPVAVAALDMAHWLRLLLDPTGAPRRTIGQAPATMPLLPQRPGAHSPEPVERLLVEWHHGAMWLLHLDPSDGRLLGMDAEGRPRATSLRVDGWEPLGPLVFPTRRWELADDAVPLELRITALRSGLRHPAELFAGDPRPGAADHADIAALMVTNAPVPGTAYLVLTELRLQGRGPFAGLLDTGASRLVIDDELAAAAGLPIIGRQNSRSAFGSTTSPLFFADRIDVGERALDQVAVLAADLPPIWEVPADSKVRMIIGGERMLELAPVLDLREMRLSARGRPVTPLATLEGTPAFLVPFERGAADDLTIDVEVEGRGFRAQLDTGMPHLLRLPAGLLAPLGLPDDAASWRTAGGVDWGSSGIADGGGVDLLVPFERVSIGPVIHERPYVLLAGMGTPRADDEPAGRGVPHALVGAAALLPFSKVGIDSERNLLELLPDASRLGELARPSGGEGAQVDAPQGPPPGSHPDDRIVVPPPGPLLGFVLSPPHSGAPDADDPRPHDLPHVHVVIPGTPAHAAGLQPGDRLEAINGTSCRGMPPAALFGWGRLWSPPPGGLVLKVWREGEPDALLIEVSP